MKLAFITAAAIALATQGALAAPTDYRFTLLGHARQADGTEFVSLRLVHLPDGKPVPGAIVFAPMAMMGGSMNMMAPAKVAPPAADGSTVVQVTPTMDGTWTISLSARVNGEPAVIKGAVDVELGK